MDRAAVELELAAVVERLREAGASWWPGVEIAPVAYRRWQSFARRSKMKQPSHQQRVLDLAKGLQSTFEPEALCTHPNDWQALAECLADVLQKVSDQTR